MQSVLDGAATDDDRDELERLLAADAGARAEFDQMQRMFDALARMPRAEPPAGFADRVISALHRSSETPAQSRQPFAKSGVIGPSGSDIIVRKSAGPATTSRTPSEFISGSQHMSTSKRGLWIAGGVAVAVAALFVGGVVQFPSSGENATGTIAPAQRFRAPQPGEAPVGTSTSPQGGSSAAGAGTGGAAAGNAANNAAANAANNAAANAANNAAANAANNAAANAANNAAANAANNAASNAANNAAANAANNAAASGARNAANNAAANAANNAAANAAKNAAANAGK
jgi:anti-sigma factor RsiW